MLSNGALVTQKNRGCQLTGNLHQFLIPWAAQKNLNLSFEIHTCISSFLHNFKILQPILFLWWPLSFYLGICNAIITNVTCTILIFKSILYISPVQFSNLFYVYKEQHVCLKSHSRQKILRSENTSLW